jgi:tetratricopeptide (TPR) repeat protein
MRGTTVGGYEVLELLGRGGMGEVWKARDPRSGDLVAIKMMPVANDLELIERFEREAKLAATVRHPNVAAVLGCGVERGIRWIAFELVTGGTFRQHLERSRRLDWREAVARGVEIAEAIAAVHARGLVHRDVKPENLLIDAGGRTKLADFGLARPQVSTERLTETGAMVGTLEYMAPEQVEGRRDIDGRADLHALGVVLYEALTGSVPFSGVGLSLARSVLVEKPRPPRELEPSIPLALDALVLGLLAKDPAARPAPASRVARDLRAIGAASVSSRRGVLGLGLAIVALAVAGAFTFARPRPEAAPPPHAPPARPKTWKDHLDEGVSLVVAGRADGGFAAIERALELEPRLVERLEAERTARLKSGDLAAVASLRLAQAFVHETRANSCVARQDYDGALVELDLLLESLPDDGPYRGALEAWAFTVRGSLPSGRRDPDAALADLDRAVAMTSVSGGPPRVDALLCRAGVHRVRKRYAEARADASLVVTLAPEDPRGWLERAQIAMDELAFPVLGPDEKHARYDPIVADLRRAEALMPRSWSRRSSVYLSLANVLEYLDDLPAALRELDALIELAPKEAGLWYRRALLRRKLADRGDASMYEVSLKDFDEAVRLAPHLAKPRFDRALTEFRAGRLEAALADYEKALEGGLEEGDAEHARQDMGIIKVSLGR